MLRPNGVAAARASRPHRLAEDTVGDYFIHDDGTLWRHLTYAASPTATLEQVGDDRSELAGARRVGGVVGAPIFEGFRRLVPEVDRG